MEHSPTNFQVNNVDSYFSETANADLFMQSLTECYQNPTEIFERVLRINNVVFISKDINSNDIKGYLFYSDTEALELTLENKLTKCIYNGYALINETYRQSGALQELLEYSINSLKQAHKGYYQSLLFYAVTSNPIALRGYYKILKTVRPERNKELTEIDLAVVSYLKDKLFISTEVNGHPFTFKTGLPQRYINSIRQSILKSHIDEVNYLNELGVNESNGDRFLFYWTA